MKNFKEWLSDNLRYLLLAVVVIAVIGAAIYGVNLYSRAVGERGNSQSESQSESNSESETESETETEKETESESESESETQTEDQSESETEDQSETETQDSSEDADVQDSYEEDSETSGNDSYTTDESEDSGSTAAAGDVETAETLSTEAPVPETSAPETEPAQPVYMTINSACYMRSQPDYGDNIIGQYEAGTTVEFLEDVGGWYRVRVNGVTGYMGARFFS